MTTTVLRKCQARRQQQLECPLLMPQAATLRWRCRKGRKKSSLWWCSSHRTSVLTSKDGMHSLVSSALPVLWKLHETLVGDLLLAQASRKSISVACISDGLEGGGSRFRTPHRSQLLRSTSPRLMVGAGRHQAAMRKESATATQSEADSSLFTKSVAREGCWILPLYSSMPFTFYSISSTCLDKGN